jgi:RES domain-containing protein
MTAHAFYRALRPEWAFAPLSGEGAARNGGRWNAKGQPALYFAADPITALAEYQQGLSFRPATLASYLVRGAALADLTDPAFRLAHDIPDAMLEVDWRAQTRAGEDPETWTVAERLEREGFDGLLYSSRINGGLCLVLWHWNEGDGCAVSVEDPDGRLPRDNTSWT